MFFKKKIVNQLDNSTTLNKDFNKKFLSLDENSLDISTFGLNKLIEKINDNFLEINLLLKENLLKVENTLKIKNDYAIEFKLFLYQIERISNMLIASIKFEKINCKSISNIENNEKVDLNSNQINISFDCKSKNKLLIILKTELEKIKK